MERPKKITGIVTQGAKDFGNVQFVTAFKVAHSDDGQSWTMVMDEATNTDKVRAAVEYALASVERKYQLLHIDK